MFRNGFVGQRLRRFNREEEGSIVIFSLFLFLTMVIFGGVAVDLMLYENRRTHVQNATDRAVLAAANLKQTVPAKEVVKDYLRKVGIVVTDDDIDVEEIGEMPVVTGRQVSVRVAADSPTLLMRMVGVDTLPYGAASRAEESINDVEVSLILDVSGSMGSPMTKLENMQAAAKDFVQGVLEGSDDDRVSISLVPYSTQVSAGPALIDRLVTKHDHEFSHCVNFVEADFGTTAIQRYAPQTNADGSYVTDSDGNPIMNIVELSQTASFDPFVGYNTRELYYPVCRDDASMDIVPWSNNATHLSGQIDTFTPSGNTSIDVAMKWGTALLDPSMNAALNSLEQDTGDGVEIDSAFIERPRSHDYPDVLKFIVLMTDGINTTQYELRDEDKEGMSDIYWAYNDHWIKVGNDFWNMDDRCWNYEITERTCKGIVKPEETDRLTKLEMWDQMSVRWRAYRGFYLRTGRASDYYEQLGAYGSYDGPRQPIYAQSSNPAEDTKDKRLSRICTAAKDAGIVVFTIGFEVTDDSAAVMEACASSDQHFYRVNGEDIQYAFAAIKNQINQLKLTQ